MTAADIKTDLNSKCYWLQVKMSTILSCFYGAKTISPGEEIWSTVTFPYYSNSLVYFVDFSLVLYTYISTILLSTAQI